MLCRCEGLGLADREDMETGDGLCLQGGRAQMGWVLKAQWKGIDLILIPRGLEKDG